MPSLKQDPPAITLTHLTIMVGYFGLRPWLSRRRFWRARAQAPGHMSKTGFAVGAAAVDKPTLLAARAAEVSAWRCRGWEREWGARFCSEVLVPASSRSPPGAGGTGRGRCDRAVR